MDNSTQRGNRRAFDPTAFTRAQATRIIANTTDPDLIGKFSEHGNKHVKRYVAHKLGAFATASAVAALVVEPEPMPEAVSDVSSEQIDSLLNDLEALATEYGEDFSAVRELHQAKGGDLAAVKRSLISRKSAKTRAAKKANQA